MLLVAVTSLGLFLSKAQAKLEPFAVVDSAYGYDSSVTMPQVSLATNQAAWDQMWAMHTGTKGANLPSTIRIADDRPPVDFKKNFVIGFFGGGVNDVDGFQMVDSGEDGKNAIVRFSAIPSPNTTTIPRLNQPFGFAICTLTRLKVLVQIPDGRDNWKTVATFDPPMDPKKRPETRKRPAGGGPNYGK